VQLSDLSVRRPVLAGVMAILISLIGLIAFVSLPVREYPDVDPPVVSVETDYTGASASVVENRITEVIEERLAGIEGLKTIERTFRSSSTPAAISMRRQTTSATGSAVSRTICPRTRLRPKSARSTPTSSRPSSSR
jgi:multidrug efflux pump